MHWKVLWLHMMLEMGCEGLMKGLFKKLLWFPKIEKLKQDIQVKNLFLKVVLMKTI